MCYLKVLIYTRSDMAKPLTNEQKLAAAQEFEGMLPEFGRWLNQLTPHAHYVHEVHLVWLWGLPTGSSIGDLVVGLLFPVQNRRHGVYVHVCQCLPPPPPSSPRKFHP
jgi:hypothetical protein